MKLTFSMILIQSVWQVVVLSEARVLNSLQNTYVFIIDVKLEKVG